MLGQLLDGRYKVIEELAAGGFAQTYLAEDTRLPGNPRCVVKHFNPAISEPAFLKKALELFKIEAETLQQLGKHDQIPQLFAYFEENNEFFLVQEFIEGHPLSKELLPNGQLPESRVISLIQDVLEVLRFVHNCGVIHRDIKPNNLLRRHRDGKLVLIDFGTVKQIHTEVLRSDVRRHVTMPIGTPGYMSSEQERGNSCQNSDIYSLGMMGLQALTGMHPSQFSKDEFGEVQWRQYAKVSQELGSILAKMIGREPTMRYQTVDEVQRDLEKLPLLKTSFRILPAAELPQLPQAQVPKIPMSIPPGWVLSGITAVVIGAIAIFTLTKSSSPSSQVSPISQTGSQTSQIDTATPPPIRDRGSINYGRLEGLLSRGEWKAADAETYDLMLIAAGTRSQTDGIFHTDELINFSCADLVLIDQLWRGASKDALGFSAQKKIYESVGKDWIKMAQKVGWRSQSGTWLVNSRYNKQTKRWEYLEGSQPNFQSPPAGHLPIGIRESGRQSLAKNALLQRCL
jgi:eukaryotic-like serine/threonine-protein kinase